MANQPHNGLGIQAALSIAGTAQALTLPSGTHPGHMLLTVEVAPIRWWADGTDPTSSEGHLMQVGDFIDWMAEGNYKSVIERFRAIRQGSNSATVQVSFYE